MDAVIRNAFLHVMASLFGKVKDCIEFQLDPAVFDMEQFLRVRGMDVRRLEHGRHTSRVAYTALIFLS